MTDPVDDVDYGTRAYLQELRELLAGDARGSGPIRVTVRSKRAGTTAPLALDLTVSVVQDLAARTHDRGDRQYHAVIYDPDAERGDRAVLVVPIESDPRLDSIPPVAAATFYGTLQRGHEVAVSFGEDLYFPLGPAFKPGPLVPRFRASARPSSLATLPGYLNDSRYWKTRSLLPTAAIVAGVAAIANQSLLALVACVAATSWFAVVYRRWRSTSDPFDDGVGPVEL